MFERAYYSVRTGQHTGFIGIEVFAHLFRLFYDELRNDGYFEEIFGYCEEVESDIEREIPIDIGTLFLKKLKKPNIWPIQKHIEQYSKADFFDVIELLYDFVSEPYGECFRCYYCDLLHHHRGEVLYNKENGQKLFRVKINEILKIFDGGYELTVKGEVCELAENGLICIFDAKIPEVEINTQELIEHAIQKYRRRGSSRQDRKDAIRSLGDILEPLRKQIRKFSSQDESDLFEILNNFGLRHNNSKQKTDYDSKIFDSWLFYHYLAAVHAYLRLLERQKAEVEKEQLSTFLN